MSATQIIFRCQTYEGGIGGAPGNEAHGGYTYCGVSAVAILNSLETLDVPALTVSHPMSTIFFCSAGLKFLAPFPLACMGITYYTYW